MGWQMIKGHRYYYRYARINGKVVTSYGGTGLWGEFEAMFDAEQRAIREKHKAAIREQRQGDRKFDAMFDDRLKEARRMAGEFLRASGYHQHKRQWRKARTTMTERSATGKTTDLTTTSANVQATNPPVKNKSMSVQGLDRLVAEALGTRLIGSHETSEDEEQRGRFQKEIARQAERLAGDDPSELEWAISVAAALAWGAQRVAEYEAFADSRGQTIDQSRHKYEKIDRAQRRYVSALKLLAQVRALVGPSVLVVNKIQRGGASQTVIERNGNG